MGSQPTPPSPSTIQGESTALGAQQQQANVAAQGSSAINQSNPYGSENYSITGYTPEGTPIYSLSQTLSGPEQNLFNTFTGTQNIAGNTGQGLLSNSEYQLLNPTSFIGNETQGTEGALMGGWLQSQEPFYQTQTEQLNSQLYNQGLTPGTEGYDNAMRQLTTNQVNAVAGAASQFEPQAFGQATTLQQLPLTEAQQLAQWGAPQSPTGNFATNTPQMQPSNYIGAYQGVGTTAEDQYNAQQAQYNAMLGGIGQLGAAGIGAAGNYAGSSAIAAALLA